MSDNNEATAATGAAATSHTPGALDGSAAVNLAAEQSVSTASRNIAELEGLPIPAETARQSPPGHQSSRWALSASAFSGCLAREGPG